MRLACEICSSENVDVLQNEKNKISQGNPYGVIRCKDCHQLTFFILKFKNKYSIRGNEIVATSDMKVKKLVVWTEDAVTPWLWNLIEESSQLTGRPVEAYYTHVKVTT
jgi:uncharacterized Zn finger protein